VIGHGACNHVEYISYEFPFNEPVLIFFPIYPAIINNMYTSGE
jgi:hypothetical protein